jgi:ATP-dependent DNA ligase
VKHDGHRIAALADGKGGLRLLSRNGVDRTTRFAAAVDGLAGLDRSFVIDGEIAAPDERGVTHLDDLAEAIGNGRVERLAYFAFDLLHLDGYDLRACPLVERKALLAALLAEAASKRIVYVDHLEDGADRLLDGMRQAGGEGIVAKRAAGRYRAGPSREWLKTKCSATGAFVVTGYRESAPGALEAVRIAELIEGKLCDAGEVRIGVGRRLLETLRQIRAPGRATVGNGNVTPLRPELALEVKYFGRHRSGVIRDGVIRSITPIVETDNGRTMVG